MKNSKYIFPELKRKNINRYCEIKSVASYIPEKSIDNEEIIVKYNLPFKSSFITKSIGVESRFIAEDDQSDSDLLALAAEKCLNKANFKVDRLSRIIVNKFYGDNLLPMTASALQRKLNSGTAVHAFDIEGGISSFLHAFDAASRFISTGDESILIASGGINSKMISKTDPRVAFLFGDAAAAILIGHSEQQHILASYFYSNYEFYELATAITPLTLVDKRETMTLEQQMASVYDTYKMGNWKDAEDFYKEAVYTIATNLFLESGLKIKDIDLVLVTENNRKIWELTLEVLGVGEEKSISLIKNHGNTMSAMLPLLLDYGFATGKIQKGMNIMLISHGEGLSGGGIIYKV
ncbi:3-oxoacyl-ACP synthase III family protein [Acetivibrio clariflavus]|uniref:3-oxoacyl-(Acyl-carrier-protein) synthase III n=1 Tax=Acetivibrio clariflavus (strain DSM 19732 / NBRC 101661 / EBR45) TaxID=720554 RepID=G8LUT9_ACECE|nr:3-oxoacyl-[acyl-carrier-protein] synthase III C-terminal domain-containing protein [Acetivibrio clariflavus]AEV68469.1 3-oxoacyl-(acyl-carrier-protein) synthase III [Acetivibrio clariflavus DSM 19732]